MQILGVEPAQIGWRLGLEPREPTVGVVGRRPITWSTGIPTNQLGRKAQPAWAGEGGGDWVGLIAPERVACIAPVSMAMKIS